MNTVSNISVVSNKLSELSALKSKMDALSAEVDTERTATLQGLHTQLGYESPEAFVLAYRAANPKGRKTRRASASGSTKRKARVSITPEKRGEIQKFFKAGGSVTDAVAKFEIAIATAQNIKKEAGMVNERK